MLKLKLATKRKFLLGLKFIIERKFFVLLLGIVIMFFTSLISANLEKDKTIDKMPLNIKGKKGLAINVTLDDIPIELLSPGMNISLLKKDNLELLSNSAIFIDASLIPKSNGVFRVIIGVDPKDEALVLKNKNNIVISIGKAKKRKVKIIELD